MKKNWKTTLLGLLAGIGMIAGNFKDNGTALTAGNLIPAIAVAALGVVSKDGDVTGGTREQ